jgi:hypothetical protein
LLTHFQGPLIGGLFFQRQLLLSFFQVPLRWMVVTPTVLDNSIILLPVATPISQWMNESKYKKNREYPGSTDISLQVTQVV